MNDKIIDLHKNFTFLYEKYLQRIESIEGKAHSSIDDSIFKLFNSSLKTILFVHGMFDCPESFLYLANELHKKGYNILVIKLDGFSNGGKKLSKVNINNWRYTIEECLNIFKGSEISVIAHSFGCLLALDIAQNSSSKLLISKLLFLGPALKLTNKMANLWANPSLFSRLLQRKFPKGFHKQSSGNALEMISHVPKLRQNLTESICLSSPLDIPIISILLKQDNVVQNSLTVDYHSVQEHKESMFVFIEGCSHTDIPLKFSRESKMPLNSFPKVLAALLNYL